MAFGDKKIIITDEMVANVHGTGVSFNTQLEEKYEQEIKDYRSKNKSLEKASATKIALIDNGLSGDKVFNAFFATQTNEFLFPAYMLDLIDSTMAVSDIMPYLVGGETPIEGTVVKAPTLDLLSTANKPGTKMSRVAEGAEIPRKKVTIGSATTELYKKAIGIEQTYEAMRNMRIDLVGKMLRAVANDLVQQNVDEATKVLESGSPHALATTGTANVVTASELYDACIDYFLKYGYAPTTIIADTAMYKSIAKLTYSANTAFGANQRMAINIPQLNNMQVDLIKASVSQASNKNRALVYNRDMSIQRFVSRGSTIQEYDKNILTQTQFVTLSEISGYAKFIESVGVITSA